MLVVHLYVPVRYPTRNNKHPIRNNKHPTPNTQHATQHATPNTTKPTHYPDFAIKTELKTRDNKTVLGKWEILLRPIYSYTQIVAVVFLIK